MKKIAIKEKEYGYRYSLRALFVFERITGKAFSLNDTMDMFTFFYAMLLACNPDGDVLPFDEFIDECDLHPEIGNEMGDYLMSYFNSTLNRSGTGEDDGTKKK